MFQIGEEVAKLLELKAQLGDEGSKKFVLKCPKVCNILLLPSFQLCLQLHLLTNNALGFFLLFILFFSFFTKMHMMYQFMYMFNVLHVFWQVMDVCL